MEKTVHIWRAVRSCSLRVIWCKLMVFTMRCHWPHYFMQFRQLGSVLCRRLYPLLSFESSGVENNMSLCDRNPIPEMLNAYPTEEWSRWTGYSLISPNPVFLGRVFPSAACLLNRAPTSTRLQLLQTSTSVQMMEFASAVTSYFFFSPSLLSPPSRHPFHPLSFFKQGAQWLALDL